jgi:hypothetical protein
MPSSSFRAIRIINGPALRALYSRLIRIKSRESGRGFTGSLTGALRVFRTCVDYGGGAWAAF